MSKGGGGSKTLIAVCLRFRQIFCHDSLTLNAGWLVSDPDGDVDRLWRWFCLGDGRGTFYCDPSLWFVIIVSIEYIDTCSLKLFFKHYSVHFLYSTSSNVNVIHPINSYYNYQNIITGTIETNTIDIYTFTSLSSK